MAGFELTTFGISAHSSLVHKSRKHERFRWYLKLNGELVGQVGFVLNCPMLVAEIGYAIDENQHDKGIATQAVSDLVQKVFSQTELRKFTAGVHEKNIGSIRVLEKAGFQREGVLREQWLLHGVPATEVVFGLLRTSRHEGCN